jgi:hypothetical protein
MSGQDDGSRGAAVRELGEEAVRAAEVEVVKANADRLSMATFRAMGIPADVILEGLGLEAAPAAARPALIPPSVRPDSTGQPGSHDLAAPTRTQGVER